MYEYMSNHTRQAHIMNESKIEGYLIGIEYCNNKLLTALPDEIIILNGMIHQRIASIRWELKH